MRPSQEGAAMSSKQLARTVKDGKLLTFHLTTGEKIGGYLCGMDDYHWMIATLNAVPHLIHKGGAIVIDIAVESTYGRDETPELEKLIAPFRKYITEEVFGIKAVAS